MAYTLLDAAYAMYYPEAEFKMGNPFRKKKKGILRRAGGFAKRNAGKLAGAGLLGAAALRYGGSALRPNQQNMGGGINLLKNDAARVRNTGGNAVNWAKSKNPFGKGG